MQKSIGVIFARAQIHRRQSWRMKAILMLNVSLG